MRPAALAACAVLLLANAARAAAADSEAHPIDVTRSRASFLVTHIFVDRVSGTIPIVGGSVVCNAGSSIPSSVRATLDPGKIESGDPDRNAALAGPDYFDARRFPVWTFVSSAITAQGPAAFAMDGLLTIHGVAQPAHLDVTVDRATGRPVYRATGKIDRHLFGMKGQRLDPVIGGIVDVTLDIATE